MPPLPAPSKSSLMLPHTSHMPYWRRGKATLSERVIYFGEEPRLTRRTPRYIPHGVSQSNPTHVSYRL